jgi:hypothetical protein
MLLQQNLRSSEYEAGVPTIEHFTSLFLFYCVYMMGSGSSHASYVGILKFQSLSVDWLRFGTC